MRDARRWRVYLFSCKSPIRNLLTCRLLLKMLLLMVLRVPVEWDPLMVNFNFCHFFNFFLACSCGLASGKVKVVATTCPCQGSEGSCVCAGGQCACSGCGRQDVNISIKAWVYNKFIWRGWLALVAKKYKFLLSLLDPCSLYFAVQRGGWEGKIVRW